MASGKWQKKTIVDLYVEREREGWYFKALGIFAACLILLGPCLFSCVLGTLNAGITIAVDAQPWSAGSVAAIALGTSSSVIYTGVAYLVFRKVERVRNHEKKGIRKRGSSENFNLLPEEELQRQNLERLLVSKGENRSPQQTYRIGIPDNSVALRTPPPLTAPLPGLGLSGTIGGPTTPYGSQTQSALPLDDHFTYQGPEPAINPQRAALEAARQKARIAQQRAIPPSPRDENDTLPWPPVIVNTRHAYTDDISEIPLSERHPLERQGHIPGRASKDKADIYNTPGVYRSNEDYGGHDYDEEADEDEYNDEPTFEIVEGSDIHVDLTKDYARQQSTTIRSPHPSYNPAQLPTAPGIAVTSSDRQSYRRTSRE